ncbi:hypothetical protein P43SY_010417 [Pythium insidiosum]|uniref:Phospholipid-transporting ATPase n=1 Tax=Pythium insidiosum TaxID=114742 RepID=A0AAD5Q4Q8_PYTIN|nr:hypothetical protein P43SY_010417 [Pythium insidiosum]
MTEPKYASLRTSRAAQRAASFPPPPPPRGLTSRTATAASDADYRVVALDGRGAGAGAAFCSNVVITSKYTAWNFFPLFMIETFRKLANFYFLLVAVMQCIPAISNTNGMPTNLPALVFIIFVDAVLAIVEDYRRHKADDEANSTECQIVSATYRQPTDPSASKRQVVLKPSAEDPGISLIMWSQLTVGTVVKLRNRETAPADLLILAVDEQDPTDPTGICYVETKSLDGETNLKLRQACDLTLNAGTADKIAALRGYLRCENPNRAITRFDGTLAIEDVANEGRVEQQPVNIKNIILRGCQLRNTEWMFGLVVNTGPDTKIVQSMDKPRPKWSSIHEMVNKMLLWVFIAQMSLCVIGATTQIMWLSQDGGVPSYLLWDPSLFKQWLIGVGYYFLLLYQMIPISLYVTISIVMLMQAFFMTFDLEMYHDETDSPMKVRSMGLNEELGQISYVFSDKTGTLTCNVMEFRKCSINGTSYGTGTTEIGQEGMQAVNASDYAIAQFHFLEKLLLHHGRLNYKRMSMLVPYMFYKNTLMVVAQYFFMFTTGSSAQKFYSEFAFQLYNLIYTSIPIGVLGVFDYDVPWSFARKFPELYQVGPRRELFNYKTFGMWVLTAYYDAALICLISLYCFNEQRSNEGSAPLLQYGIVTFTLVVLISSLKFVVIQMSWTVQGGLLWFFSVMCYLPTSIWLSGRRVEVSATDFGQFENTLHFPSFWFTIVLGCVGIIIQNFAVRAIQRRFYPQPWHIVQELFVLEKSGKQAAPGLQSNRDIEAGGAHNTNLLKPEPPLRRRSQRESCMSAHSSSSRRQRMSSFAFSFDPETTAAESFMASHCVHDAGAAIHEAEAHCRVGREDMRASDYRMSQSLIEEAGSPHRTNRILSSASSLSPSQTRQSQPGLFTW